MCACALFDCLMENSLTSLGVTLVDPDTHPVRLIDDRHDTPNTGSERGPVATVWPEFDLTDPFWIQFSNFCNRSIADLDKLTPESECIIWHGPRARYDLNKPMFRSTPALTSRKNGSPQYHYGRASYSSRNLLYAAFRSRVHGESITKTTKGKRSYLRLASRCSNVSCVNPAHHYQRANKLGKSRYE